MSGARARLFLALDLPEDARGRLADWRDVALGSRSDVRPVAPEALHVTLVFLGWQDESAAEEIAAAAFGALPAGPPPRLAPTDVRSVPPRDPRLFALDLDDEGDRATGLQGRLSAAVEAGGWYRPEKRPFWPHITLARVKRRERRVPPLADEPPPPGDPFEAAVVTLYKSTMRPQGSLYEPLARTVAGDALDPASKPAAD
ncbi:MAG TPA: RNA 2',3'-cyclic phosphodiesterase [Thermoleophilaceae bacterium]|nr:RNA 2',3'-cyclic phosphodiesterase [Thermoleophilaceae bacterium]